MCVGLSSALYGGWVVGRVGWEDVLMELVWRVCVAKNASWMLCTINVAPHVDREQSGDGHNAPSSLSCCLERELFPRFCVNLAVNLRLARVDGS